MAFWGVEVKPGKPFRHSPTGGKGRLHVSQATLGIGSASNKSIVQCNVGSKSPVFLCSLFPERTESSQLNLEFDEADEVVFSVLGPRSVHITGFYVGNARHFHMGDESESYGEDIKDTETDRSEDNDVYEDSFINDDDPEVFPPSPCPSGEGEITADVNKQKKGRRLRKKYHVSESDSKDSPQLQNAVKGEAKVESSDSEDAVGSFFKSLDKKSTTSENTEQEVQKADSEGIPVAIDGPVGASDKRESKRKKKRKAQDDGANADNLPSPVVEREQYQSPPSNKIVSNEPALDAVVEQPKKKKKKKKKINHEASEDEGKVNMEITTDGKISSEVNGNAEATRSWTLPSGLIVEDLELGNPDGKVAAPGKKISVHFIGKTKENGRIIDSNIAGVPLKFRLGAGKVMGGWDDGVDGMQVGGRRRLIIPPSLHAGSNRLVGKEISPKAWLIYDIEVVRIR